MPDFLIRNVDKFSQFALFLDSGSIAWKRLGAATGFASAELAREAFAKSCQHRRQQAVEAFDKAREREVKQARSAGREELANRLEGQRQDFARRHQAGSNEGLSLPEWVRTHWNEKMGGPNFQTMTVAERPTERDLLGVFDQYFVRGPRGWLSRPQTQLGSGFDWSDSFSFAVAFFSAEEAARALGRMPGWVVKATGAFTAVEPVNAPDDGSDRLSHAIAAACEARDIRQGLSDAAEGRLQAMDAAPARKTRSL